VGVARPADSGSKLLSVALAQPLGGSATRRLPPPYSGPSARWAAGPTCLPASSTTLTPG